jgi:hypothetical protein
VRRNRLTRVSRADLLLAALLFGVTTLYVSVQPRNLSPADESVYLYQAKRVLEGAVLYRDVFEITTPGWMYLMAALFALFGVDLATARVASAVLHGITAVLIYLAARRLAVRPGLAWPPALAYLVVAQPAWPIASQHWLGTLLTMLLLATCAGQPGPRPRWSFWPGVVIGLLIGVHQQRGVLVGGGIVVWLVVDHLVQLVQRRGAAEAPSPPLLPRLAWLALGVALVVMPLGIAMIAAAGFAPVWHALVVHPMLNYGSVNQAPWGQSGGLLTELGSFTFPRLLKYLPVILIPDLARLAVLVASRQVGDEARRLILLVLFAATSMLSIAYRPDYVHIAFIAPVFFIAAAELLDWAVDAAGPARAQTLRAAGWCAGALLVLICAVRLQHNLERSRALYPVSRETAFGHVDFASPLEAQLYDKLDELLGAAPSREIFCYPVVSYLYLMLDADNPTRYQFLLRGYSTPAQMDEVVSVLEQRRLPYIVAFTPSIRPDDPILLYLRRDYEPLADAGAIGQGIFRRKRGRGADRTAKRSPWRGRQVECAGFAGSRTQCPRREQCDQQQLRARPT